jgi:hypothetical protein
MSTQGTTNSDWFTKRTAWQTRMDAIAASTDAADTKTQSYKVIYDEITQYIKRYTATADISTQLQDIGKLQLEINALHKSKNDLKNDVETALARDESLRSRDIPTNPHALFLLNRPVRRSMIPYLWALGVLFIGITLTMYYALGVRIEVFGTTTGYAIAKNSSVFGNGWSYIVDVLLSRNVLLTILGACLLTILILSLKIGGVF